MQILHADAHCDIPCGIYEPTPAKIAAKTVLRMVEQLEELVTPEDDADGHTWLAYKNSMMRRIIVKEQHAELCKRELETLWSDFFKPEHLADFPNLHETFWQAVKLCSKNKQEINHKLAMELVDKVDEIAKMFYTAKKTPERLDAYKTLTDKLY